MTPLFVLAAEGRGISMFQYAPYFVYGCALYYAAARGARASLAIAGLSLVPILWQFFSAPSHHPSLGFERAVGAQFVMLMILLGAMTLLAFARFSRFERIDRFLGDLTYPLYLSHVNVMIYALSMTDGYSYGVLAIGFPLSLLVAYVSHELVDPFVDRFRNTIRRSGV